MAEGATAGASDTAPALSTLNILAGRSRAQSSAENFPVAMRLLPRRPRDQLMRLYTYARFVDDVGDEAPGDRLALLDLVAADVRRLPAGQSTLTPVADLRSMVEQGVPLEPLLDLVEANRVDQRVTRYATFDDLLGYCRLSAAPVGRVVLALAGIDGGEQIALSDSICAGLQVLEHCQDVGEDARAGRVYLPAEDLRPAGVTDDDLLATTTSPGLRRVVAQQVERAGNLLAAGRPLLGRLTGWSRVAVTGYLAGGVATAASLRARDHDVLALRIRPGKLRTAGAALRLATGR